MKNILLALLMLMVVHLALAADITGRWSGKVGDNTEIALDLRADGKKLIGSVMTAWSSDPIQDGKINGDSFSFTVVNNGKLTPFEGKISGDKMELTVTMNDNKRSGTLTKLKEGELSPLASRMRPQMTEYWEPVRKVVDPG